MTETPDTLELLVHGTIEIQGRLTEASNTTLLCGIAVNGVEELCVYKPVRGERPLWDFPDGTLAGREVATYLVSEAAGFDVVPPTVLRDGPFGPGMVQRWIDVDEERELVDIVAPKEVGKGWRTVLRARGSNGDPALLVHADDPALHRMAALDVVVNNADRKGGHIIPTSAGHVYGVDHGICFSVDPKLRTLLWRWAGKPLPAEALEVLEKLTGDLLGDLGEQLHEHLTRREVRRTQQRVAELLRTGRHPQPSGDWPALPWPPF